MKLFVYFLVAIVGFIFAMLGLLNSGSVSFNYIIATTNIPLIAVMFLSFACGAALTLLIFGTKAIFWRARARRLLSAIQKEKEEAKKTAIREGFMADHTNAETAQTSQSTEVKTTAGSVA